MNRSYLARQAITSTDLKELSKRTAIHEAGHAAAIYFGNRLKHLPPVCFQIIITGLGDGTFPQRDGHFAKVEGGRLIHTLPSSITEAVRDFSDKQKQAYSEAFDADMMNLLVGPLAEANYIALRDDEIFNSRLITFEALSRYGGATDVSLVEEYLDCYQLDPESREQKKAEIFAAAFQFINDRDNWRAIMGLANFLLGNNQPIIACEDIISVLDAQGRVGRKAA